MGDSIFGTDRRLKLGIWGLGRGAHFIKTCRDLQIDVVAGCDYNKDMRDSFKKVCPDAYVTDNEDDFLAQDFDAVLVATWIFSHCEHSIKALNAGKHVLCEVTSFFTPAEGVRLVEAVEKSGKIYCLAENYPFMKNNMCIKKLWDEGLFGELSYAEYQYVHDCRSLSYSYITMKPVVPGNVVHQWRSWLNFHYYCTHSLGPVMYITGTRPMEVSAPPLDLRLPGFIEGSKMGGMCPSLVRMSNGGVVRNLMGAGTCDIHGGRIWGTRAFVDAQGEKLDIVVGQSGHGEHLSVNAEWPMLGDVADKAGHGGGDFWELYFFAREILTGEKGVWDVYSACDVTMTGIMAVKSQLEGGKPIVVPDFRDKATRELYRNDNFMQQHFDTNAIFPENQDRKLTEQFNSLMVKFNTFSGRVGTILVNAAFDGMKLYPMLADYQSRLAVTNNVRKLLDQLPELAEVYRQAKALADAYPDSLGAKAINENLAAGMYDKIMDTDATAKELRDWLKGK